MVDRRQITYPLRGLISSSNLTPWRWQPPRQDKSVRGQEVDGRGALTGLYASTRYVKTALQHKISSGDMYLEQTLNEPERPYDPHAEWDGSQDRRNPVGIRRRGSENPKTNRGRCGVHQR